MGVSSRWGSRDADLLDKMLNESKNNNEILREFKERRREGVKGQHLDGGVEPTYEQYMQKEQEFYSEQELVRSFMRMEQGRELPIDKYIKAVYTYKGRFKMDKVASTLKIMKSPKGYLEELTAEELSGMIPEAEVHAKSERMNHTKYTEYWSALIDLIKEQIQDKEQVGQITNPELQEKVNKIMNKSIENLLKLEESILASQKQNSSFS